MPFCPNCNSEYEDWVDTCADCNVPLNPTSVPPPHRDFVRSMFRPIGASWQREQRFPPTDGSPGELPLGAGGQGEQRFAPTDDGTQTSNLKPQTSLPREQGRNRRLKTRFLAPFHPPAVMPTAPPEPPPPLPADTVLPVALNFDLHTSRSTYDPAGDAWVVLISAPNEIMANIVRSQLGDAGIPALVKLNAAVDTGQFINNSWVARDIWVQARDIERAREVVDFYHNGSPITEAQQREAAEATASGDDSDSETKPPPLYEQPWLPAEHYEDPDMVAANASVDEYGRPLKRSEYHSPMQRPWFRWLTILLLLAWAAPTLFQLLGLMGQNIMAIFR